MTTKRHLNLIVYSDMSIRGSGEPVTHSTSWATAAPHHKETKQWQGDEKLSQKKMTTKKQKWTRKNK